MSAWTTVIIALATLLVGGGGIGALVKLWMERKKPEVETRAVEVAAAGDSVAMALEVATASLAQTAAYGVETEGLRARVKAAEKKADELERRFTESDQKLNALTDWAHDVVNRWEELRQFPHPPQLPQIVRRSTAGGPGGRDREQT